MSRTYWIEDPGKQRRRGLFCCLFGSGITIAGPVWFMTHSLADAQDLVTSKEVFLVIVGVPMVVTLFLSAHTTLWELPHTIVVHDDRRLLEFRHSLRVSTVRVGDVRAIERTWGHREDDGDARELAVHYPQGTVRVLYFPDVDGFVTVVQALNPALPVTGSWEREPPT